jgi:hypothetical protein
VERLRAFAVLIRKRRRDILLVALWTIAIAAIIVRAHQQFYIDNPMMSYYHIGFSEYYSPTPSGLELLLILFISLVVTVFLVSTKSMIFGYFASMFLSCSIAVVYMFLFNWYALGLGATFLTISFGWEWVLFQAIINTFRYFFPLGLTFSLIGLCVGSVVRMLTNRG